MKELCDLVKSGKWDFTDIADVYTRFDSTGKLLLFNYRPTCQFKNANEWNFIEKNSRGLIINRETGEIVARPFAKFWNWGQGGQYTDAPIKRVYEKADGSLGILYKDPVDYQYKVATRGSFHSDQADWATKLWNNNFNDVHVPDTWTILFEIIYPDNRVVVDYGDWEGLAFLGAINKETGQRVEHDRFIQWYENEVEYNEYAYLVQTYDTFNDLDKIIEICKTSNVNVEGFVVEFEDGQLFKFKGEEYLKAHKLISNLTEKNIYEAMINGEVESIKTALPDEFVGEFNKILSEILEYCQKLTDNLLKKYNLILKECLADWPWTEFTQKDFALTVKKHCTWDSPYMFFAFKINSSDEELRNAIMKKVVSDYQKLKKQGVQTISINFSTLEE